MSDWDICNDGGSHQWRHDPGSEDGMVCAGCGVSEAELAHLIETDRRRSIDPTTEEEL